MTQEQKALSADTVIRYLSQHPDFFIEHPEALDELNLEHGSGSAVSLLERQIQRSRDKTTELNRRLHQLIQTANDNEQLMARLHALTLELLQEESLGEFLGTLETRLIEDFNADRVVICLYADQVGDLSASPLKRLSRNDSDLKPFDDVLQQGQTLVGRLNRHKRQFLFGAEAEGAASTALVPLAGRQDHGNRLGMLAIGSDDPSRFYPGMGTWFLELLGGVVSHRLVASGENLQRRSA